VALAINTRATRLMVQLAREMRQLESFVHVSTAFSNCIIYDIKESFYPEHLNCSSDKVLAMTELMSEELLDNMESALLGSFVSNQFQLHDVGELLVRQFSRLLSLQLLLGIEKLGVGPGMGWV